MYNIFDQIHSGICQRNVTTATSSTYVDSSCAVNQIHFIHSFLFKYLTIQVHWLPWKAQTKKKKTE